MNYLKKVFNFIIPYKKYAFLNIISNVFYALFSTLSLLSFIPMLNILFQTGTRVYEKPVYQGIKTLKHFLENSFYYFVTQQIEQKENGEIVVLSMTCLLIISLFFLKNLSNYIGIYFITHLRNGVIKDMRNSVYQKIIELPISFFSEKRKGDVISRITNDVQEVQWSVLSVLEMFVKQPLNIIFTLIAMFSISTKLTLFIFIFIPLSGASIAYLGKKLRSDSAKVLKENGVFLSYVEETLTGLKVIKSFTAERFFSNSFFSSTSRLFKANNKMMRRQGLASPISEFLGVSIIAVILWYGGKMVFIDKTLNGGTFLGFMALAYNILTPAKDISNALYSVKRGNASAERVLEILETKNPIFDVENVITKKDFTQEISLKNISFKYEDEYVLKNFSLVIPKGKMVALVGQSGSGKSTIANLLTRFYDVNKGSIELDGINIKSISKQSLRSLNGLVTQDAILFNDSIKNNVLFGLEKNDDEIIEALKIANAWEFVKELPKGIETNIGDSGNKLSGGQKQRISIARAVLKNSPIMILDEATSALDSESEKLVQEALENMMKNRTSVVIAHRLSTIQNADIIVVMRKGEIVEQGTHKELLALQGEYYKLVTMQSLA